jgi:hypothetical protein
MKTDLREIGWSGIDWIHLVQDNDQWKAEGSCESDNEQLAVKYLDILE